MIKFSSDDTDYDLLILLLHTKDAIIKARQKALKGYNLSSRQSGVLFAVQVLGRRATPAEISRFFVREPHSVSELLIRMEKQGLLRKFKDLEHKNLVRIELTEKGLEAHNQSARREEVHRIINSLSEKKKQQLKSCLLSLRNAALKELGLDPKRFLTPG